MSRTQKLYLFFLPNSKFVLFNPKSCSTFLIQLRRNKKQRCKYICREQTFQDFGWKNEFSNHAQERISFIKKFPNSQGAFFSEGNDNSFAKSWHEPKTYMQKMVSTITQTDKKIVEVNLSPYSHLMRLKEWRWSQRSWKVAAEFHNETTKNLACIFSVQFA